jgi:hypothetical protein
MANQDLLHEWWWSPQGPKKLGPITIHTLEEKLLKAREAGVVIGRGNQAPILSPAGWNYAVLRFLIVYCTLPNGLRDTFIEYAHPRRGNYRLWRNHLEVVININR